MKMIRPAARARAIALLDGADLVSGDINELAMSALGLIEAIDASGDGSGLHILDQFIDRVDVLVKVFGFYLDELADRSWAFDAGAPPSMVKTIASVRCQRRQHQCTSGPGPLQSPSRARGAASGARPGNR
jgi:hypothetical protein